MQLPQQNLDFLSLIVQAHIVLYSATSYYLHNCRGILSLMVKYMQYNSGGGTKQQSSHSSILWPKMLFKARIFEEKRGEHPT